MDKPPVERPHTVAGLVEKRREIAGKIAHHQRTLNELVGVHENERNLNNEISRGGFTAGFFVLCLRAIGCQTIRLEGE
jgi:ABC-type Fe3+-citrate transport system substrate-binding protein